MDSIVCVFCRRYLALKKMRNKNKFFCIFSLTYILVCDRVFGRRFGLEKNKVYNELIILGSAKHGDCLQNKELR